MNFFDFVAFEGFWRAPDGLVVFVSFLDAENIDICLSGGGIVLLMGDGVLGNAQTGLRE